MKIEVTTHSGDKDVIEVEDYDAEDVTEKRNNPEIESIQLGNISYSRIDLKNIKPFIE